MTTQIINVIPIKLNYHELIKLFIMKNISIFFICCLITINIFAQPGTLDRSFGDTGVVITQFSSSLLSVIAIQPDNKIIAAGQGAVNNINGFLLSRYLTNGSLDTSFGIAGISLINNIAAIHSIVILDDNSIMAAGSGYGPDQHIQLAKYSSDGNLDSSFGENGQIDKSFQGVDAMSVRAAKLQQDGKIVIAGAAYFLDGEYAYQPKIMTARFNADGSVDKSFGGKGYVLLEGKIANALIIQPDGKIVIGGDTGLENMFITARYLPDGSLDTGFGHNGIITTSFNHNREYINALALQPDGKIIAAGKEDFYIAGGNMGIVRYLPDGSLDESFGNGGLETVQFKNSSEATGMALQTDGKIVLTGSSGNLYDTSYLAVARLNANGLIDSSFGTNGLTETNIDGLDFGTACALQQDGKIILGGQDKSINLLLARYNNDVQNKNPIARIKKWIEHHILHWQNLQANNIAYYTIEQSNNATNGFTQIAKVKSKIINK